MSAAIPTQALWVPGQGLVPTHVRQAMKAVEEYDADLSLARHEQTGDWVVLLKRGPMQEPHPVFGLGPELPAPEEIKRKLYQSDVRRHGRKIVDGIMRDQERRQKEQRDKVNDQTGVAAEALEWAFHKEGRTQYKRIFVPKGVSS